MEDINKLIDQKQKELDELIAKRDYLKPCPFCGSKDLKVWDAVEAVIECRYCGCEMKAQHLGYGRYSNVREAWNRRITNAES